MRPVRRKTEARQARALLAQRGDGGEVRTDQHRDGRARDGDEARVCLARGLDDVGDELFVVAHDGLHLRKAGDEYETVHVVPARLVVGVVGGVAAGGVVDDGHAAELVERGAHAGDVGGVGGDDRSCLFHTQYPQPRPFGWIWVLGSFSWR